MTAESPLKAVTGNRLSDGVPIYFAGNGTWSIKIGESVTTSDGDALLTTAVAGPLPLEAIGPYLIDVKTIEGAIRPVGLREEIRAFGPTA